MKIILNIKTNCLSKGDIVYYDGKQWVNKSQRAYLLDRDKDIEALKKKNDELNKAFAELKASVNEKLKQYHDILQLQVENN